MSRPLISRSDDLLRLVREGYSVSIVEGHLVVDDVPFLSDPQTLGTGRMVTPLNVNGGEVLSPSTHIMYWVGPEPVDYHGKRLGCYHSESKRALAPDLVVSHQFSCKRLDDHGRKRAYESYHEMVVTYAAIFSDPATAVDQTATPKSFKPMEAEKGDTSPFAYPDTSSIRGGILNATARFSGMTVAIVGLGGTGAYILDLVAKTRVARILLFDDDQLLQHNAFRTPGAVPFDVLCGKPMKVEYLAEVYRAIHPGIEAVPVRVTKENVHLLDPADFVFVAIDDGPSRGIISDHLDTRALSYLDVGLGVELLEDDSLTGQLRTTLASDLRRDHISDTLPTGARPEEDDYDANIQVSDLNALNASLAVFRWKRLIGFYRDARQEHHSMFRLRDGAHVRSILPGDRECED